MLSPFVYCFSTLFPQPDIIVYIETADTHLMPRYYEAEFTAYLKNFMFNLGYVLPQSWLTSHLDLSLWQYAKNLPCSRVYHQSTMFGSHERQLTFNL